MSRLGLAIRHYYFGLVTASGLSLLKEANWLGVLLILAGLIAQWVYQWRAGNEDDREKRAAR